MMIPGQFGPALHRARLILRQNMHGAKNRAEMLLSAKPMAPPVPQVAKARGIKTALLVCSSEESGFSHPHNAFFGPLSKAAETAHFDFLGLERKHGRAEMNRMLVREVERSSPDLVFFMIYRNEVGAAAIRHISERTPSITFNCFADDEWRFDVFSRYWAPNFNFCSTTDEAAYAKYLGLGYGNVLLSRWSADPDIFHPVDTPVEHDVSFVGTAYDGRRALASRMAEKGVKISWSGSGWPGGALSTGEMVRTFCASRINLNFSRSLICGKLQMKTRIFEAPACGGFVLTEWAPPVERCFRVGKEIAVFRNERELAEQVEYYLSNEGERLEIAEAGRRRVLREHTGDAVVGEMLSFMLR